jgi:hypothetical protein
VATSRRRPTPVYLETGAKKVFACSLDWPGWCRSAKDADGALAALADYASRYQPVAKLAGLTFDADAVADHLDVVERLKGSGATDYGVPYEVPKQDHERVTKAQAARLAALVEASWKVLDRVVAHAPPSLRKGPRGGGRDRDAIAEHVDSAEEAYARKLGIKLPKQGKESDDARRKDVRAAILDVLSHPSDGSPVVAKGWPVRYGARRVAWHALDHAWEIEDRSKPAPE